MAVQNFNIDQTTGLRADKTVELTIAKSKRLYPKTLRLVEFYDNDSGEMLVFLTNNFDVSALEVARLYQQRWQIEVFSSGLSKTLSSKNFGNIAKMPSEHTCGWQFALI